MSGDLKFIGSLGEIQEKMASVHGVWEVGRDDVKIFRYHRGVLNWYPSTGKLFLQGKEPGLGYLNKKVSEIFGSYNMPNVTIASPSPSPSPSPSLEDLYISGDFKDAELVIGVVHAVGT